MGAGAGGDVGFGDSASLEIVLAGWRSRGTGCKEAVYENDAGRQGCSRCASWT